LKFTNREKKEEEKGIVQVKKEGQRMTLENKMPNATKTSPKRGRSSICTTSLNKTSFKKCVTKF
jgi:hypothetical protein